MARVGVGLFTNPGLHTARDETVRLQQMQGQRFSDENRKQRILHFHSDNIALGGEKKQIGLPSDQPSVPLSATPPSTLEPTQYAKYVQGQLNASTILVKAPVPADPTPLPSITQGNGQAVDRFEGTHRAITTGRYPSIGWGYRSNSDYGWNHANNEITFHERKMSESAPGQAESSIADRRHALRNGIMTEEGNLRVQRGACNSWQVPQNSVQFAHSISGSVRIAPPKASNIGSLTKGGGRAIRPARGPGSVASHSTTTATLTNK
mmetsp:Transcript_42528/g.51646  ORF Transcript_42528/g.51646 Transcript_42528/m.51646 type:complete len:264 (+) Transcript_42528:110-901(+)|eukprot:CAMPEP_0197854740 /NCGR_PEP_ID=MMETSP1438-20131217/25252_1 /TAXON_ID=1461541 /ORGANISM="Pterosperma sp., Strain CCMP1384" /LENGTH=263 /DNA_ID=CAMNT_0043469595 /DNA_START=105 /DNA_END=896 /DNA_ORIENTATION=+